MTFTIARRGALGKKWWYVVHFNDGENDGYVNCYVTPLKSFHEYPTVEVLLTLGFSSDDLLVHPAEFFPNGHKKEEFIPRIGSGAATEVLKLIEHDARTLGAKLIFFHTGEIEGQPYLPDYLRKQTDWSEFKGQRSYLCYFFKDLRK